MRFIVIGVGSISGDILKVIRSNESIVLEIAEEIRISIREEWLPQINSLTLDKMGDFLRQIVYPSLSKDEQKLWNKSQISNKDLFDVLQNIG